jgi:alginate O-acetyltransferase complex protein AlgI
MVTLAYAIFFGCKWLTWWRVMAAGVRVSSGRSLGYLVAWPGMDACAFFNQGPKPAAPTATQWCVAFLKTGFGAFLLWGVARQAPPAGPLLTGWVGLVGLLFIFFFGVFHLLALTWQQAGVDARYIMRAPLLARSLSDFWGARWNLAFHRLVHDFVFQPLRRRLGIGGATFASFLASGLVHELVISLPARAGYGLPTLYFLLQGAGVLVERSALGERCGLEGGLLGRFFTLLLTAGPATWLFHPPFITRVIIPLMHAIAAL